MKIDCQDQSDENYCWQIDIDESQYRKSVAPENPSSKEKLEIGVCFELLDIAEVNEPVPMLTFTILCAIAGVCSFFLIEEKICPYENEA